MNAKKTLIAVGIAAVMPLTMAAKPAELPDSSNGHGYGLGCHAIRDDFANPGEMWRAVRDRQERNPKEKADQKNRDSVGDFINWKCDHQ